MSWIGTALCWICVVAALVAVVPVPFRWWTRAAAAVSAGGAWGATGVLAFAFVTNRFDVSAVAEFGRSGTSAAYRIAGLWGGMSGSLLLWTAMCATGLVVVAGQPRRVRWRPGVALLGATTLLFGLVGVLGANPFVPSASVPVDGAGLVPILEFPAMLVHPPLVYLGLVATLLPLGLHLAGASFGAVRRAALGVWAVLLFAMVLGAFWAYAEVGWGGFWAWDPVENVSLIPWLLLTGWLHLASPSRPRVEGLVVVAACTFGGATLVRSGAVTSVHAFAQSPVLGWWLAGGGVVLTVCAAWAARAMAPPLDPGAEQPAESTNTSGPPWRAVGGWTLVAASAVVAVGTYRPLVGAALGGEGVAVATKYFTRLLTPVGLTALAVMGPAISPQGIRSKAGLGAGATGALAASGLGWLSHIGASPVAVLGVALGGWTAGWALQAFVSGRTLAGAAHAAMGICLAGVFGSSGAMTATATLRPNTPTHTAAGTLTLRQVQSSDASGVSSTRPATNPTVTATVAINEPGRRWTARPRLVAFVNRRIVQPEPDQRFGLFDTRVALRLADENRALVEVTRTPMAWAVWLGALLLVAAATFGIKQRSDRSL